MPCYYPLHGWYSAKRNESGKRGIVFQLSQGQPDMPVVLPCGQCIGCRMEKARQWGIRCMHEATLYEDNVFVTLTYDDEHLPRDYGVDKRHFQLFMKRLRFHMADRKVRYFACGEYGEQTHRPHYHAILFNCDFKDKKLWKENFQGDPLFISEELDSLWQQGHCCLGAVTFASARYVAGYILKKVRNATYIHIHPETGEVMERPKEFALMSRKPGIGRNWIDRFPNDVFPSDSVVVEGREQKPPRYYDEVLERLDEDLYKENKWKRVRRAKRHAENNTSRRHKVREEVAKAKLTARSL